MKKYILGEVEFVWHDGMCTYYCSELDGHRDMLEQDLIKLGATEVKEDEWEDLYLYDVKKHKDPNTGEELYLIGDQIRIIINQLIKNQQYLKRRLDDN